MMNGSRKPFSPNSEVNIGVPLFSVFQSSASLPLEAARLIFSPPTPSPVKNAHT